MPRKYSPGPPRLAPTRIGRVTSSTDDSTCRATPLRSRDVIAPKRANSSASSGLTRLPSGVTTQTSCAPHATHATAVPRRTTVRCVPERRHAVHLARSRLAVVLGVEVELHL